MRLSRRPVVAAAALAAALALPAGGAAPAVVVAKRRPPATVDDAAWAFRPIRRSPVPATVVGVNPIDAFLDRTLKRTGLAPALPADRRTLLRRATFDLHGLPPTAAEVEAFVADARPTPAAFREVVERLLASPRYGEKWGRHWLDVVRYADTGGGSNDFERPNAWR
ncbi:MAG: DUF1549 domain-containing protein, partial [Actinomycetota bacterium]